jgi:hypothetical protein
MTAESEVSPPALIETPLQQSRDSALFMQGRGGALSEA